MTVLSLDHGLDPVVLVPRHEQERRAVLADGLVLLEARLDAMGAGRVRALADEARLGGVEALRRLGDPLVHLAEQRLRLRDLLRFLLGHSCLPRVAPGAFGMDNGRAPDWGAGRVDRLRPCARP